MKTVHQEFSTLGVGVLNRFDPNLVRFPELRGIWWHQGRQILSFTALTTAAGSQLKVSEFAKVIMRFSLLT